MSRQCLSPFESIESAHEFLVLLRETAADAKQTIGAELQDEKSLPERRVDTLRIVLYNIDRLDFHLGKGIRILNDLRSLQRLLLQPAAGAELAATPKAAKAIKQERQITRIPASPPPAAGGTGTRPKSPIVA